MSSASILPARHARCAAGSVTRSIEAARDIASGDSVADVSDLLAGELAIGCVYLILGLGMLRYFELDGRCRASLDTY